MDESASVVRGLRSAGRPWLVGLDVDGTLAPIVTEPSGAKVPAGTVDLVQALAARDGVEVALITGRDGQGLARMIPTDGLWLATEHGSRVIHRDGTVLKEPKHDRGDALEAFRGWVRERFADDPRVLVEHKVRATGVHARLLDETDRALGDAILDETRERIESLGLFARQGKRIMEAEAAPGDKGEALRILHGAVSPGAVFYAGDDVTDGPAIAQALSYGGVGVFVAGEDRVRLDVPGAMTVQGLDGVAKILRAILATS